MRRNIAPSSYKPSSDTYCINDDLYVHAALCISHPFLISFSLALCVNAFPCIFFVPFIIDLQVKLFDIIFACRDKNIYSHFGPLMFFVVAVAVEKAIGLIFWPILNADMSVEAFEKVKQS